MQNLQRRLQTLERLPQPPPMPSALEQIRSLALESISSQDLELLRSLSAKRAAHALPTELSEGETDACASWAAALEAEARGMGFTSYAEAERTAGQRR